MEQLDQLREIVLKHLPQDVYLVDLSFGGQKLQVIADHDEGLSIDVCAQVSRDLGEELEARELISNKYTLEVSSPGLDQPLVLPRQYAKNVGRELKIILEDDKEKSGKLEAADEEKISLLEYDNRGKSKAKRFKKEPTEIALADIKKATIVISF